MNYEQENTNHCQVNFNTSFKKPWGFFFLFFWEGGENMTLELLKNQGQEEKDEQVTCEKLLARLPEVPHWGTSKAKEPHATDLSPVKPKRKADQEEKKDNPV
jgi:hypothetical protein